MSFLRINRFFVQLLMNQSFLNPICTLPVWGPGRPTIENRIATIKACIAALEAGDTLVVWRLDRLGRSMPHLASLVEELMGNGIGFRSLLDGALDTTTASGELMFHIFSSLAQFERRLVQERTTAGLAAARARGRLGGRPAITAADPRVAAAKRLHKDHSLSIDDICKTLGWS